MSLVKFRNSRMPWFNGGIYNWLDNSELFSDDFFTTNNLPAMNVKENKDNYEIELAVPGFSKKEIEVSLEDDILHICAERSMEDEDKSEDYTRKEFSYNSFDRKLKIPKNVNQDKKVKASYKNGVLNLKLDKVEASRLNPRKLVEIE